MGFQYILVEQNQGLATITLNRPERLNALWLKEIEGIHQALDAVEADDAQRVVIVTGSSRPDGRPCFCAGLDVKEIAEKGVPPLTRPGPLGAIESMAVLGAVENPFMVLCDRLESFPKPTIAAIDGVCVAGGLELVLSCDLRVVSETAQISDMHLKNLGLVGGGGSTVRLTRLVGPSRAKELVFMDQAIDGQEAYRMGLANKVTPPAELMGRAREWGLKLAALDPVAVRLAKASINASLSMNQRDALRFSYICWAAAGDAKAGAQAFFSSREKK